MNQGESGDSRLSCPQPFWRKEDLQSLKSQTQFKGYPSLDDELKADPNMRLTWNTAYDDIPHKPIEDIAVHAFTLNTQFHRDLNKSLTIWHSKRPNTTYPYKNYLNLLLSRAQFYSDGLELYKGISAHSRYVPDLGTLFYTNQLGSASLEYDMGHKFTESGTLYKFKTKFAIPIESGSKLPDEKEYLIPFGMEFKVVKVLPRTNYCLYDEVHLEQQPVVITSVFNKTLVISNIPKPIGLLENSFDPDDLGQMWYIQWKSLRSARTGLVLEPHNEVHCLRTRPFSGSDEQFWDYSTRKQCLKNKANGLVVSSHDHAHFVNHLQLKFYKGSDKSQRFEFVHP